jgi:hypothetical protein
MSLTFSFGAAMVLTASLLSGYGWVSGCPTCMGVQDGGFGSFLTAAGLALLFVGGPLERWWRRRAEARFDA